MRWEKLFDDLESQLEHELNADDVELRAEEYRLRLGRLTVRDRLVALAELPSPTARSAALEVDLSTGESIRVVPQTFGRDWFAGDIVTADGGAGACVVALQAIVSVAVPPDRALQSLRHLGEGDEAPRLTDRIGLAFALRDLCRRRSYVSIAGSHGIHRGTIDRVGRDHLDLAVHESGTPRRESEVRECRVIPLHSVALVTL